MLTGTPSPGNPQPWHPSCRSELPDKPEGPLVFLPSCTISGLQGSGVWHFTLLDLGMRFSASRLGQTMQGEARASAAPVNVTIHTLSGVASQ